MGGKKTREFAFFFLSRSAFRFFRALFSSHFRALLCIALASAKAQEKRRRPPLLVGIILLYGTKYAGKNLGKFTSQAGRIFSFYSFDHIISLPKNTSLKFRISDIIAEFATKP